MKFDNPNAILKPDDPEAEVGLGPPGGDWLSRINLTINNFKELVKLAQQFRGTNEETEGKEPGPRTNPKPPARSPGLVDYVRLAIQAGYGDTPVGKLIEQVSPHTLNQILEIIKRAGLTK